VIAAALLAATTLSGCAAVSRPGGYSDTLFVLMRTQADLSDVTSIADVKERRAEVYRRLVTTADRTQAALRRDLADLYLPFTPFYLVNALEVEGNAAIQAWLLRRPEVDRVLLSPQLRPVPTVPAPQADRVEVDGRPQPNIAAIGADRVWVTGVTGPGITIGIADSGVDRYHPALAGAFRGGSDGWYDPWNGTRVPTDESGHGTHIIGTAVGSNGIGVAPGAKWIGCVDLPGNLGNPAGYLRCLQFMLAPFPYGGDPLRDGRPDRSADILVNSWACAQPESCDAGSLRPAIRALNLAGILVVAAPGGGGGPRCGSVGAPPTRLPDMLTVGAFDPAAPVASSPSRGLLSAAGRPDLVAPGVDVVSALPGRRYGALSGTSVAAPQVAGVVALLWAANPRLVGDLVRTRQLLLTTATPVPGGPGCGGHTEVPVGLVNAEAAVGAARSQ